LKTVDRIFGVLLILGACGHTIGTLVWLQPGSGIFIWSLGSSLAATLLGVLNIVRAERLDDKTLAAITVVGSTCWALLAWVWLEHNVLDLRPAGHFVIAVVLTIFSAITLSRRATVRQQAESSRAATTRVASSV